MSKAASDYTVDEIAITLGLKDNSYRRLIGESHLLKLWEGTTSNDPSFPPLLLPAVEPWQNLARMVSDLETNGTTVLPEFTHRYLPELIQAHYLASASEFSNFWTRVLVLIGVVGNASFDRFARKPIEGAKLLDSLLRMFADNFPGAAVLKSPMVQSDSRSPRVVYAGWVQLLISVVLSRSVKTQPQAAASSSQLLLPSLQALATALELSNSSIFLPPWYQRESNPLLRNTKLLVGLLKGDLKHSLYKKALNSVSWWRCEAMTMAGGVLGGCINVSSGVDVLACGRCHSVRYCSVVHQRAHWKEHQKTCWEPVW